MGALQKPGNAAPPPGVTLGPVVTAPATAGPPPGVTLGPAVGARQSEPSVSGYTSDVGRVLGPTFGGLAEIGKAIPALIEHPIASFEGAASAANQLRKAYWQSVLDQGNKVSEDWGNAHYLDAMGRFALGMGVAAGGKILDAVLFRPALQAGHEISAGHVRAGVEDAAGALLSDASLVAGPENLGLKGAGEASSAAAKMADTTRGAEESGEIAASGATPTEHVSQFEKDVTVGGKKLSVPVTATTAKPGSFSAQATQFLGNSLFGRPISRVRVAQNAMAQRVFEGFLRSHMVSDDEIVASKSPLALMRLGTSREYDTASQMFDRVTKEAGQDVMPVPLVATANPNAALSLQDRMKDLDDFVDGGNMPNPQYMTVNQIADMRTRAAAIARGAAGSSNGPEAMIAGLRVQALDKALADGLTASGKGELANVHGTAVALWHDASSLQRVQDKLVETLGKPSEVAQVGGDTRNVWNLQHIENTLNDPNTGAQNDLLRVFGSQENLDAFRRVVHIANADGGTAMNRLALGVGSLFLGNYPVYRAVWTLGSLGFTSPHALLTTGSLLFGYRVLSTLAVEDKGSVAIGTALKALQAGKEASSWGAILSLGALAQRNGLSRAAQAGIGVSSAASTSAQTAPSAAPGGPLPPP